VKEVLVGDDTIVIRHSILVPSGPLGGSSPPPSGGSADVGADRSYLLRTGSDFSLAEQHSPDAVRSGDAPARLPADAVLRCAVTILATLGVQLNVRKTRIVHVRRGFAFLGYTIKRGQRALYLPAAKITSTA
jgi:hypothetical protein